MGTQSTWGQYSPDTSLTHRHSSIMASPCICTGRPEGRRLLRADLRKISYYYDDERRDDIVEAEVKDMFRDFLLVNPDGNVSREDFLFTLEEMEMDSFKQGLEKEGRKKIEEYMFKTFDENGDGYISFVEWAMCCVFIAGAGTFEDKMGCFFNMFDANRDGSIGKEEMTKFVEDLYSFIKTEVPDAPSAEEIVNNAFKEMDVNSDGKITRDEFIAALKAEKELSEVLVTLPMKIMTDS